MAKCDTSGLLQLGSEAQGRIETAAAADKIASLDGLLSNARVDGKKRLIFVDDKSTQLFRTYQDLLKLGEVEHRKLPEDIMYMWLRSDAKTKNVFPSGFPSLEELTKFIKGDFKPYTSVNAVPVLAHSLYLIDFDRTLMDTDKWFRTVQERIATEVCSR
jgi:hypothetical protein